MATRARPATDWLWWVALGLLIAPGLSLVLRLAGGGLGARPLHSALRATGDWALWLVLLTLAVSPARVLLRWPWVVGLRRALGVAAAAYATLHLLLYCQDENWHLGFIASEITLRFYLSIGTLALLMLLALAATSTNASQRRLGRNWKRLHALVFPALLLSLWHDFLEAKADISAVVLLAGFSCWLLAWRLLPAGRRERTVVLVTLGVLSGLAAALSEAGWYWIAVGVPPQRVLATDLSFAFGPRPAAVVALAGLAAALAAAVRRLLRRPG